MFEKPPLGLLIVLFVAVPLFIEGLYLLLTDVFGTASKQTNRRLAMISKSSSVELALRKLQRHDSGFLGASAKRAFPRLERMLVEAGVLISASQIIGAMAAVGIFAGLIIGTLLRPPIVLCVLFGVLVGVGPALLYLQLKKANRLAKFAVQLPDAIDLMVRGLQVGHPAPAAVALVAKHMSDPIGTEFGIAADEVAYGRPLDEALTDMTRRVPQGDLRYLVSVIQIQHQAGGNLAEVLQNLAAVIRARFRMFAKIKAVSAEGRLSCIVIGLMPIAMLGVITALRPDYYVAVSDSPLFWPLMGAVPIMLLMGWFVMWRMVNFKV